MLSPSMFGTLSSCSSALETGDELAGYESNKVGQGGEGGVGGRGMEARQVGRRLVGGVGCQSPGRVGGS